jgi:hypothetical protein
MLESGYVVFPHCVERIDFLGPPPGRGESLEGRARIRLAPDAKVVADLEVIDGRDRVRVRARGWEDQRIDMPDAFFRFRMSPRDTLLSSPWPAIPAGLAGGRGPACYRFVGEWPLSDVDGGIWRLVLAHLVLSRRERRQWMSRADQGRRRLDWLAGMVAAKDAARALVRERSGVALYPADIEIVDSEDGLLHADGGWAGTVAARPLITIAHLPDLGVAAAVDASRYRGVGVAVERIGRAGDESAAAGLAPEERALVPETADGTPAEWLSRMRCAKEAVARALGRGKVDSSRDLVVRRLGARDGIVRMEAAGALARRLLELEGVDLHAHTVREGDLILALSMFEGSAT